MNHLKPHAMRTVRRTQLATVSSVPWYASQHVCPPRGWCWKKLPVPILEPPIAKEIHGCYCWMKLRQGPQVAGSDVRSQSTVMGTPRPVPGFTAPHCGHCCRATTCRTKNCQVFMVFAEICWFLATILLMVVQISSCLPTAGKALCRIEVQICQIANPMSTLLQRSRSRCIHSP